MAEETWLHETLLAPFSGPEWSRLVLALGHSLWQGAAVIVILAMILRCCDGRKSQIRYAICVAALLAAPLTSILTWSWLSHVDNGASAANTVSANSSNTASDGHSASELLALTEPEPDESGSATAVPLRSTIDGIPVEPFRRDSAAGSSAILSASILSPLTAVAWVAGVLLMLVRLVMQLLAGRSLCQTMLPADSETTSLVSQLAKQLGIGSHIRVTITEQLRSPAIMGAFWPVLLLPGSVMTGLTAEQLKVVIIHELAHIRRHDYLVNLGQMLIESLLFFNPAVWWISRQLRIEREACADAMAVAATDNPLEYATVLAAFAESLVGQQPPALAQNLSPRRDSGSIADRIRRVLAPAMIPNLKIHWASLCGALVLSSVAVFATEKGAQVVVEFAARLLTPEERMEVLTEARAEVPPIATLSYEPERRKLTGTIKTEDGKPLPWGTHITALATSSRRSGSYGSSVEDEFSINVPNMKTHLHVTADGYAPLLLGPLPHSIDDTPVDPLDIVLKKGTPAEFRLEDAAGRPVADAQITCTFRVNNFIRHFGRLESNTEGIVRLEHPLEAVRYDLKIRRSGFEMLTATNLELNRDDPPVIRLAKAQPTTGVVTNVDGRPVANARVMLYGVVSPDQPYLQLQSPDHQLTTTNDAGQLTLNTLAMGKVYFLDIRTENDGRHLIDNVVADEVNRSFQLGPELVIEGTVTGDVDRLLLTKEQHWRAKLREKNKTIGTHGCYYQQDIDIDGFQNGSSSTRFTPVSVEDGVGHFRIGNLLPGSVTLHTENCTAYVAIRKPVYGYNFHIDDGPVCNTKLILRFNLPDGNVSPEGEIMVQIRGPEGQSGNAVKMVPILDGKVEVSCYAGGSVHISPNAVVGAWFEPATITIGEGSSPTSHNVPLLAAGAIAGVARHSDGRPLPTDTPIKILAIAPAADAPQISWRNRSARTDREGKYFLSPIPLGGTYFVYAQQDPMFAAAGPIRLNAATPLSKVNIVLPRGVHIHGKAVDRFNRPLSGIPVKYGLSDFALSHTSLPVDTDASGRFTIGPINPDVREHFVVVNSRKNYQSTRVAVADLKKPIIIRLKIGKRAAGVIRDRASGWPIPNAEVYARSDGEPFHCEAETRTDSSGRFRFSNLPDKRMKFVVRGAKPYDSPDGTITSPPGNMKMTFRVEANSELKPREPH